jgi:gamma-glutamylcyclotransferase (GGCT)/AIG2-like uncharacterized protein YtfP
VTDLITDVFVYGTLQRHQCRGSMWPCLPLLVRTAFVQGQLFDLGPYPALCVAMDDADVDWIAGEVWTFSKDDILQTMTVLDAIEECNQSGGTNLYDRVLLRAHPSPASAESVLAFAYQFSDARLLSRAKRVHCHNTNYVAWPNKAR